MRCCAPHHSGGFLNSVFNSIRVILELVEEVNGGHCRDHFGKTSDLSNFVDSFAVIMQELVVFAFI